MNDSYPQDPSSAKVTVTLKAGTDYDAPWIVFYGSDAAEVADRVQAAQASGLFVIVGNAAAAFRNESMVGDTLGATPTVPPAVAQQQYQQQPPQQGYQQPQGGYPQVQQGYTPQQPAQPAQRGPMSLPPGAVAPTCPHGTKTLLQGQYGPFWACPAQRNDPSKCKAEKFRG